MDRFMAIFFAICAGIFTTLEATINSKLANIVTPKIATLHNLLTGVLVILVANILKGTLSQYSKIITVSPQLLIGGAFGTIIVYLGIKSMPELGATITLSIIVVAQLISALLVDVFLLHHREVRFGNIIGVLLLVAGTYLILKK